MFAEHEIKHESRGTEMRANISTGIKCEWSVDLINAKTGIVERHIPFHKNTILDTGMAHFVNTSFTDRGGLFRCVGGTQDGYFNAIAVGSGTATPAFTDTALGTFIAAKVYDYTAGTKTIDLTSNTAPITFTMVASFNENEANGNISEMGLLNGLTNTAGKFFCRNRIVDVNGDPTTIVKDSSHTMTITARVSVSRTGNPFADTAITEVGDLGTNNTVVSFVNNQWLADAFLNGSSSSAGGLYTQASVNMYASATALSFASGIANTDYTALASAVNGTGIITKPATGKTGDNYWVDLKVEIPQAVLNLNIASLVTRGFAKTASGVSGVGEPGLVCKFATPLPKTSAKKVYLTFRHTWARV